MNLFIELIQVAIGARVCLSKTPTTEEWTAIYAAAKNQSLLGVCFAGVQKLQEQFQAPPEILYLQWMGMAAKIQQRNEVVNRQCAVLTERLGGCGLKSCVLKGQGVATLYRLHDNDALRYDDDNQSNISNSSNLSMLRQSGDIDVWIDGDRDEVFKKLSSIGVKVDKIDSVHAHAAVFADTEVEVHSRPSWMYSSRGDKAFTEFWTKCKDEQFAHYDDKVGFCYPTVAFNLVYSLLHINRHIFEEGIGLRQLMDYYLIMMASTSDERKDAMVTLKKMGLGKFAAGIMHVEGKVFGLSQDRMLCEPNAAEGEFLLKDILIGGNFGRHDERNVQTTYNERWKRGWYNLIRNLRYLPHYPEEVLSIPFWNVKHYVWRKRKGYL